MCFHPWLSFQKLFSQRLSEILKNFLPSSLALSRDLFSILYVLSPQFQFCESAVPLWPVHMPPSSSARNAHPSCLIQVITFTMQVYLNVIFLKSIPRPFSHPRLDWSLPVFATIVLCFSLLQNFSHLELFFSLEFDLPFVLQMATLLFSPYFLAYGVVEVHGRSPITICYLSFSFWTWFIYSQLHVINHKCAFSI